MEFADSLAYSDTFSISFLSKLGDLINYGLRAA